MIASIEWGENQTFKKSYSIVKVQMRLALSGLPARFLSIQYYIGRQKAIVNIDKKNYLFYRRHLCNFLYYIIYKKPGQVSTVCKQNAFILSAIEKRHFSAR